MEIVGIELKKITVGKFFPKENEVELDIFFNDGTDKEIFKMVDTCDPKSAAENILNDLRKLEKNIHGNSESKSPTDNVVNIVIKEEDRIIKEIPEFIQKTKNKMDEIRSKNVAEGYLDKIRELKSLKIEF